MAQDSQLPALISETLPEPQSFDGWDTDKLLNWLREATATLVAVEKWTDAHRLNVGAALHLLRDQLGDGDYGRTEKELADHMKISTRTLKRWRAFYEESRQLAPPSRSANRVEGQKRRQGKRVGTLSQDEPTPIIEATAEEIPNTHLSGLEPDNPTGKTAPPATVPDDPAPPAPPSTKDENEAVMGHVRGLLRSDVAVLSRAAKRSVLAELEGLLKRAQQADADDGSRVVLLAPDLVARLAVAPSEPFDAGVNRAIRDLLAPKPAATAKRAVTSKARPAPSRPSAPIDERAIQEAEYGTVNGKCIHPPSRVRNGLCFLCGAENIKASR